MAFVLTRTNFYFRAGESPEAAMRIMLESMGLRVTGSMMIPLSLSGGMRMNIFADLQGRSSDDVMFSLNSNTGFICVPVTVFVGSPEDSPPPAPIPPKTIPQVTNQVMLNAFRAMAAELSLDFWGTVVRCNLQSMAIPNENRGLMYSGPALEDLPLTPAELASLKRHLGL